MKVVRLSKLARVVGILCVATALAAHAQTLTTLFSFDGTDGFSPTALIQATDGNFYGTTSLGGSSSYCMDRNGCGTVFKLTPDGTITTLFNFCHATNCPDGMYPTELIQGSDGNFYGTTIGQQNGPGGAVYKITPTGKFTKLHSFCHLNVCNDGEQPEGALVEGTDGNFYGTTFQGGAGLGGTVYKITPTGTLTVLYSFCSPNCSTGYNPAGGLVQASNGIFYGTTSGGGANQGGTVFGITPSGKFSTVYNLVENAYGASEDALELIQGANGSLYGTTKFGDVGSGTIFDITLTGKYTFLHFFCFELYCNDGATPLTGLAQGSDGNLYGVTSGGGPTVAGNIFEITPAGTFTVLHNFCSQTNCADGAFGWGVIQGTDGAFYGAAYGGGGSSNCVLGLYSGCGVVFRLSTGLDPFVQPIPGFGPVGRLVRILGNNLIGTTSVTFNGTAAKFKVVSDTYIRAQVPTGATTGTIEVTTPSGTLKSNVAFRVIH